MKCGSVLILLMVTGCASTGMVKFDSSSPGVAIDVDGNFMGKTPIQGEVTRERDRWSHKLMAVEIRASKDGCVLTKHVEKGAESPKRVYFDLAECSSIVSPSK